MATFEKAGYGQVELNHMTAPRTGQIYAQLPAKSDIKVLENGMFVKYDIANEEVNFTGEGEWMLVYNEVKLYDVRQYYKDFALKAEDAVDGVIVPRVYATHPGDIFTTNMIEDGAYVVGDILTVGANGILAKPVAVKDGDMQWQIVKIYTMADGQDAVKVMRLADAVVA